MTFFIELLQERRTGGCMTKVAGTFHVPSARPSDSVKSKTGHGTWNVPATLRAAVGGQIDVLGLIETEAA